MSGRRHSVCQETNQINTQAMEEESLAGVFVRTLSGLRQFVPLEHNAVGAILKRRAIDEFRTSETSYGTEVELRYRGKRIQDEDKLDEFLSLTQQDEVLVKPASGFYGTFVDEILIQRLPLLTKIQVIAIKCVAALVWSLFIAAFAQASFYLSFDPRVPYTLQTFGIFLGSFLLGEFLVLAVVLYLLEGAAGLPFFAGGQSGLGSLTGLTAGYLWGFLLAGVFLGYACRRGWDRKVLWWLLAVLIGDICVFFLGVTVLAVKIDSLKIALVEGCLIFLPGEVVKACVATVVIPMLWFGLAAFLNVKRGTFIGMWKSFFNALY